MIETIFSNYFYSLITPPNKEELFTSIRDAKVNEEITQNMKWYDECKVYVEALDPRSIGPVLLDTLNIFFEEIGVSNDENFSKMRLTSIWKNTYEKGYYQDLHDHMCGGEMADLSGCIFLNDHRKDSSKFYFYNRHSSEISASWRYIMDKIDLSWESYDIIPKSGDVLLFPSHMLHGVTVHKIDQPRTTVSFNIKLK